MPHPWRVSKDAAKSPLPGFSSSVHKIIETAIEKNDLDFFYRLYLTRMAELSLTGQGEEFIKYAKSSLMIHRTVCSWLRDLKLLEI